MHHRGVEYVPMNQDPFETDPVLVRAAGYPYDISAFLHLCAWGGGAV